MKSYKYVSVATLVTALVFGISTSTAVAKDADDVKLGGVTGCYNYKDPDSCRRAGCNWSTYMKRSFCIPRGINFPNSI